MYKRLGAVAGRTPPIQYAGLGSLATLRLEPNFTIGSNVGGGAVSGDSSPFHNVYRLAIGVSLLDEVVLQGKDSVSVGKLGEDLSRFRSVLGEADIQ